MGVSDFFKQGAPGRGIAGYIGDALLQNAGMGTIYAPAMRDQQEQRWKQAQLAALTAKQERYQGVSLGGGGYGTFDPTSGAFNVLREPTPEDHRPALQRNFEYLRGLPADQQQQLRPMMSGFANTEEGQGMAVSRAAAVANAQGQARAAYRAPRTGGMSPYGRSKSNPLPVKSKGEYDSLPVGAWVSPAPGVVFQKR